jgi:hypothetical protein
VPADRARQHRSLHVGAEPDQVGGGVPVIDADDVLLDDRALVQVFGHVVGRGADQLDATVLGLLVGTGADEGGQERVVDVDQRAPGLAEEGRADDLHVAGEHDEVDVAAQQLELPPLGLVPVVPGRGNVEVRHPEGADRVGQVGVVGEHHHHRHVELAPAAAPQQVQHAVVGLGHHDRHALRPGRLDQRELHVEQRGHLGVEGALKLLARRGEPGQVEFRPLEEGAPAFRGGVLR